MIAFVAGDKDVHAIRVGQELDRMGHEWHILDTRDFGQGSLVDYAIGGGAEIRPVHGDPIQFDEVRTVWYRRPYHGQIAAAVRDPDDRSFCRQEWASTFDGLLLNLDARFVNPLVAELSALKPRQLQVAAEAGLRIPDTLITNDPDRVDAFLEKHSRNVIHKALTAPRQRLLETRLWAESDRAWLKDLPLAPTTFQEAIHGPADVRATVVGDDIFAARIATACGRAGIDSRMDLDALHEVHQLPWEVHRALLEMMRSLGLVYGTVDMKITDEGEYVFFEVNPQGQFLYVEILTGLPITRALATFLAGSSAS